MKKDDFNILTAIKYIVYFAVAFSVILTKSNNTILLLILLLLYITNSQIRMYFLKNNIPLIIFSLISEIIIAAFLFGIFGGFTSLYLFISVLDASFMLPKREALIMNFIIYAAVVFESMHPSYKYLQNYPIVNVIFNTLFIVGFSGLGRYINDQSSRKTEAQKLYDQLRISQEELKDAYKRLEHYSSTVEELAVLRERTRISREIHDTVGHTMSTLIVQLQALPFIIKSEPEKADEMLGSMLNYTKTGLEDIRRAVRELSPSSFDNSNGIFVLQELIHNFQKNSGIKVRFIYTNGNIQLDSEQSLTLYRILQECFNNSLRHGNASLIEVNLNITEKEIYLRAKDNGEGCESFTKGFGLSGMEQRIKSFGGRIEFHTNIGEGFEINVLLPRDLVTL